eukprot:jgi/Bigna1/55682/estExt_Genewise1Plus.C_670046
MAQQLLRRVAFAMPFTVLPVGLAVVATAQVVSHVSQPYMDEIFHVKQTQAYCDERFHEWDEKITTPPGLYIVNYVLAKAMSIITQQHLSSSSLFCSLQALRWINIILFFEASWLANHNLELSLHACSLLLFPPFFFFVSLCYTDVGSTGTILLAFLLNKKGYRVGSAIFSLLSLIFRQTNIVWVCFIAAEHLISRFETGTLSLTPSSRTSVEVCRPSSFLALPNSLFHFIAGVLRNLPILLVDLYPHVLCVFSFILAVWVNGSVALGDKSHHAVALHVPQFFYFAFVASGFQCVAAVQWVLNSGVQRVKLIYSSSWASLSVFLTTSLTGLVLVLVCIKKMTYVHPFLLADNRHYMFYIWRRILDGNGKYLAAPFYVIAMVIIQGQLSKSSLYTSRLRQFLLIGAVSVALIPSPLLEFRYFITPFFFVSIHIKPMSAPLTAIQVVISICINTLVLAVFIAKPFTWSDGTIARFMW